MHPDKKSSGLVGRMLWLRVADVLKIRVPASCRRLVILSSSQFQHIIANKGSTSWAYAGDPLALMSYSRRGLLLESLARRMLEKAHPNERTENVAVQSLGTRVDGKRRPAFHAEWDWTFMGRRAELKTSQLCFESRSKTWKVRFHAVKLARPGLRSAQPFDDLFLLIYSPCGFHLIKHDLQTGVARHGVRTESQGHNIQIYGSRGQTWEEALKSILWKLTSQGHCELVWYAARSDPLAKTLYSELSDRVTDPVQQAYKNIPFSTMNPVLRSHRLQQIVYELDQMQNPDSEFQSASGEVTSLGCKRGNSNAAVDWIRDGVRVEVKSAMLIFGSSAWKCTFSNIKEGLTDDGKNAYFDELWLALYNPYSLDVFKHLSWQARLHGRGKGAAALGKSLQLLGGTQNQCPFRALERIKTKLEEDGAELQFSVRWALEGS